ncbi:flagellar hook-associated protein FlgK [Lachnospiraceae bacterium ZAX-1]
MANGMGSFYVGVSGLQNSQTALNTTANNLANVDTKGYVRQQVLFEDRNYATWNKMTAISWQQTGLGVNIGDVVHTREIFLDKYYRNGVGRQAFYETIYEAVNEVEDAFQELEGEAFQDTLKNFWESFQEFAKYPDAQVQQNLVVQKATLFAERAQDINNNLKNYQKNLNVQITDAVKRINDLGNTIKDLNIKIQKIEAGNVETAMNLRDERDNALDELSKLANISYKETATGLVKVKLENVDFVDEITVFEMALSKDPITDFLTPYWPKLTNSAMGTIAEVFDFSNEISTAHNTDIGRLKALVLARGDHFANYLDIDGLTPAAYNSGVGQSVIMNAEAELDQLVHRMVTAINDVLSPTKTLPTLSIGGVAYTNVRVWDKEKGALGSDGDNGKPGNELFARRGCERYTEVTADDGETYFIYNEETPTDDAGNLHYGYNAGDPVDTAKMYTTNSIFVNPTLIEEESRIPYLAKNGEVDFTMAQELLAIWEEAPMTLNPNDTDTCTFRDYYQRLIGHLASQGDVFNTLAESLQGSVASIDNSRQQVFGVSSDEELTNMIKYQNAYNASSRYINVISEMLEHIITQLGR